MVKKLLPKKSEDISSWYNSLVLKADLADYGPSKGTMIIKPYGFAIWELVQKALDEKFKAKGVQNAYFPLFIPESFLNKEKEHVEGFAPELAVVTYGGGKELEERLVVRPTSETIMYDAYSRWISSWRDLPLLINQWNNVVRWEKRTYLFLRTTEFLWQEGHTAHTTHEEAWEMALWAINCYKDVYNNFFAMDGYVGEKSQSEKFAGAFKSLTFESLMPDGKALQSCTSHDLGQNFSKAFNIKFQDKDGQTKYVWQTSWGLSTRSIGGLILTHGDDDGLILPPKIAPYQIVILPVNLSSYILSHCKNIENVLAKAGFRVILDDRDDETLGYKINKWELKGVPLRVEVGEKEVSSSHYTLVRRDNGEKLTVGENLVGAVWDILGLIQNSLFKKSCDFLAENTFEVKSYKEFKSIMEGKRGFIKAFWCESEKCEGMIKSETKATTRCKILNEEKSDGSCVYCGAKSNYRWIFAQAY